MKSSDILLVLVCNLFSIVCAMGAVYVALAGISGWGWFLFVGLIATATPHYNSNREEK
jgi:hypothetical protein